MTRRPHHLRFREPPAPPQKRQRWQASDHIKARKSTERAIRRFLSREGA